MTAATKNFSFPASVTIDTVQPVTDAIRALALQPGDSLALDASQTEIITTPGIQLLVSLEKTLKQGGGALTIANPHPAFAVALRLTGLHALLAE